MEELEQAVHAALADIDIFLIRNEDKIVRALLTALRTPSEEMVEAMRPDGNAGYFGDAFTAAIDVLLTPKDPEQ